MSVTAGSAGTSLGTFTPAGDGSLNSLHRLSYGYNRWSQSAMRQWLNSDKSAGQWWTSQNKFDRVPEQHATKAGFMSGFEKEFLDCIQPIKVVTALNTDVHYPSACRRRRCLGILEESVRDVNKDATVADISSDQNLCD